jgi:hypothetical protein
MPNIDISALLTNMLSAAKEPLLQKWSETSGYAESEFKKIGEAILFIEKQRLIGKMTEEQAKLHLEMQKNASRAILLTIEGLGILAVEAAINAALSVIRDAVNTALKFPLI